MKFNLISVSSIVGGITLTTALGIEPTPENVVPPSAILEQAEKQGLAQPDPEKLASIPFIGLSTVPLPEMVAAHVDVEPGTGLIIRTIMPESPAANAGLSVNDIILKVEDEAMSSPEQLSSAILKREIGERLNLSLIHNGNPSKVAITLGERPAHMTMNIRPADPMLEGLPQANADRLRELIERNLGEFEGNPEIAKMDETLRLMRERMNQGLQNDAGAESRVGPAGGFEFQQNSTVRMMDEDGSVELKSSNGSTEVTVRDKSGKIVWSGPWDTEQDKAAAPDDIRPRIDRVDSGGGSGFRFHFGKAQRQAPGTIEN
ncbi:PDZ domain-containing protein [Luteolibacter sp. AS25]|uniref:PDZ domain-containing protein n=1 Tax=Luteolibacter sp. AS25 TaxID=3135776 RepID=UPI00398ADCF5